MRSFHAVDSLLEDYALATEQLEEIIDTPIISYYEIYAMNQYIILAGGKIKCRRCLARSTRTGQQCQRPALSLSQTQKCQFHGYRSTGPNTRAGWRPKLIALYRHGKFAFPSQHAFAQTKRRSIITNLAPIFPSYSPAMSDHFTCLKVICSLAAVLQYPNTIPTPRA